MPPIIFVRALTCIREVIIIMYPFLVLLVFGPFWLQVLHFLVIVSISSVPPSIHHTESLRHDHLLVAILNLSATYIFAIEEFPRNTLQCHVIKLCLSIKCDQRSSSTWESRGSLLQNTSTTPLMSLGNLTQSWCVISCRQTTETVQSISRNDWSSLISPIKTLRCCGLWLPLCCYNFT